MNENENGYKGPFEKDVLEENTLSEKDFIQESPRPNGFPAWLWLFLVTASIALIWGGAQWIENLLSKDVGSKPFLEVTNREFSVFLWQFPSFLRSNVKQKTGYLTGFQYEKSETIDLNKTEDFVVAPPDLLFLYHTWHRLLYPDYISRPIPPNEFLEFLDHVKEWQPNYWKEAPKDYVTWVESIKSDQKDDLQDVPETTFPLIVRQAFQGWKNYFKDGPAINKMQLTFSQVEKFIKEHPVYARNYWRNIQKIANQKVAGQTYLSDFLSEIKDPEGKVPASQLSSFLRLALFNAEQAEKEKK
jgi:hypothetical protein